MFHLPDCVPPSIDGRARIVPPAIDQLAPKNMAFSPDDALLILNNFNNVGAIEVNAFQPHTDVVIQKSTREGFGLTVSEAIWKARPCIGGDVGGIPLQVSSGQPGFLVSSPEECAQRALEILADPGLGKRLGRAGKESVRRRLLSPRLLRDWPALFEDIGV